MDWKKLGKRDITVFCGALITLYGIFYSTGSENKTLLFIGIIIFYAYLVEILERLKLIVNSNKIKRIISIIRGFQKLVYWFTGSFIYFSIVKTFEQGVFIILSFIVFAIAAAYVIFCELKELFNLITESTQNEAD